MCLKRDENGSKFSVFKAANSVVDLAGGDNEAGIRNNKPDTGRVPTIAFIQRCLIKQVSSYDLRPFFTARDKLGFY